MDKRRYYQESSTADAYDEIRFRKPAGQRTHEQEVAALEKRFLPGGRLVELACGTGRLLKTLRKKGWDVTGVDQSQAMLEAGHLWGAPYITQADVTRLPFPDNHFDGAYALRFTNHYRDLRPFFRECARVLKPGGSLLVDSMVWTPLVVNIAVFGGRNYPQKHSTVRSFLEETGFAVAEQAPLFPIPPYILGQLPSFLARGVMAAGAALPARIHAIQLWHARKKK